MDRGQTRMTRKVLAICSCCQHFFLDDDMAAARMGSHITTNNEAVHQWIYVPDVILTMEACRGKTVQRKSKNDVTLHTCQS